MGIRGHFGGLFSWLQGQNKQAEKQDFQSQGKPCIMNNVAHK